jgi:hypothetical protein
MTLINNWLIIADSSTYVLWGTKCSILENTELNSSTKDVDTSGFFFFLLKMPQDKVMTWGAVPLLTHASDGMYIAYEEHVYMATRMSQRHKLTITIGKSI